MPICIILDPLDPLIHIEGGGGRARAGAPEGAPPEGPRAWPATCGLCWQSCKSRPGSAAGARDEHEPHHLIIR